MVEHLVHGTCVAIDGKGVLLQGEPASGKSDLALRLIDAGALLVADDQVALRAEHGRLVATAPPAIAGRLEVRGIGVVEVGSAGSAPLVLVVDLVAPDRVKRLPDPGAWRCLGAAVPMISLAPFESSTPAKVRLAVRSLSRDDKPDSAGQY